MCQKSKFSIEVAGIGKAGRTTQRKIPGDKEVVDLCFFEESFSNVPYGDVRMRDAADIVVIFLVPGGPE
jgi:hypothetical protein